MNAIFDAKPDPMGLADLRVMLHDEAGRRWTRAAQFVKRAIVGGDVLGIGDKAPMTVMPSADKAALFGRWLDERLMAEVGDGWMTPQITAAAGRAQASVTGLGGAFDAQSLGGFVSQTSYTEPKSKHVCCAATDAALAGIRDAVSRRATSAVAASLIPSHRRASRIAALVDRAMGEGLMSTRRLGEHALSMAYNQATLDALEARGVTHVGTLLERHALGDEDDAQAAGIMFITPDGQTLFLHRVDGEGWAFPGGMVSAPETLENGAVREAQEELGGHYATGQLDFATLNEDGPVDYTTFLHSTPWPFEPTLNHEHDDHVWADWQDPPEPLHPGVRQTLDQLNRLMEDFDPGEPRDEIGRWTAGEGPAGPYLIPTIRWKGKSYYGTSHAEAAHSNPQLTKELSEANWGDENVIRYTTPDGKQLDRFEARKYAEENGLLDPKYSHQQRDLISEDLFAAAVAPSHLRFRRESALAERGFTAVSPSTHEIDFAKAVSALGGEKQHRFEQASADIDHELGLDTTSVPVVGAWKDGAENALATVTRHADFEQLRVAAAMKAHLTDQKAALVFKQGEGDAVLYSFKARGDLAQIHAGLLFDGVAFHSLSPDHDGNGATVYVADLDRSAYASVAKAAERFDAKVDFQFGRAEFVGSDAETGSDREQRDVARRAYEDVIGQSKVPGSQDIWRRVHARWSQALAEVADAALNVGTYAHLPTFGYDAARKTPQAKHPRTGQFAKAHIAARERHRRRTGQFGTQAAVEGLQQAAERAQSAFAGVEGEWDVLTAGDDKVCRRCQEISEDGPYTIDRARSLIPAHPSCRCRFVEAGAVELDAGPEDEPRDEQGRWTTLEAVSKYAANKGVELNVEPEHERINLNWIENKHGVKGAGADVMRALASHADAVGKSIFGALYYDPDAPRAQGAAQRKSLLKYYRQFGFHPAYSSGGEHYIERIPRKPTADFDPDEPRDDRGKWTTGEPVSALAEELAQINAADRAKLMAEAAKGPLRFYHGAAADAVASIKKLGIVPHYGQGGDAWYRAHGGSMQDLMVPPSVPGAEQLNAERLGSVYITDDLDTAKEFANVASEVHGRMGAVVFKVTIPADRVNDVVHDESALSIPAYRFHGKIDPKWIKVVAQVTPWQQFRTKHNLAPPMGDAEPPLVLYLTVLADGAQDVGDFDPGEPRDPQGRWTALAGSQGHYALVSTANPTAKKSAGERGTYQRIDIAAMQRDPESFKTNVDLFKNGDFYPGMRPDEVRGSPEAIATAVKNRMVDNLVFLAGTVSKADMAKWRGWYEGAHALAQASAKTHGVDIASASGVIAALSPQNDWNANVYQAGVVMDALKNKRDAPWDAKMSKVNGAIWKGAMVGRAKEIEGKTLAELAGDDPDSMTRMAMWIRTENEAHSDRSYREVQTDGSLGKVKMTRARAPAVAAWKATPSIVNAVAAFQSGGDGDKLSQAMGGRHKVRSFYNNILDPHSANGDVTVDTHAVGAAWLTPSTGSDVSVVHALASTMAIAEQPKGYKGTSSSTITGASGTYGVYADAYREAAEKLGLEPRELQSVVWEAKQRLFSEAATGSKVKAAVGAVWRKFHDGEIGLKQAQREVVSAAGASLGR